MLVKFRESVESTWTSEAARGFRVLLQERRYVKSFGRSAACSLGCGAPTGGAGLYFIPAAPAHSYSNLLLHREVCLPQNLLYFSLIDILAGPPEKNCLLRSTDSVLVGRRRSYISSRLSWYLIGRPYGRRVVQAPARHMSWHL